jgi:WD40 repeat protein
VLTGQPQAALKGHQSQINSVCFSPDGRFLATGSSDGTVKIWDWRAATVEQDAGHSEWIQTVAISPDGKIFVTGSWDNTIAMWDSSNGQLIRLWRGHNRSVLSVLFSPDGRLFASAGGEITTKLWNSVTGELEKTLHIPNRDDSSAFPFAWSAALAFSADGARLALEIEYNLILWDIKTGEGRAIWANNRADIYIYSLTFAPDGHRLAAGHKNCIHELDLDNDDDGQSTCFKLDGIHRQIAYDDEGSCIISSASVVQRGDADSGPSRKLPKCMKALHLFQGWLVDSEGNKRCWVPEAYRGGDVHVSYGLTRVVLGGTNGRPLIVDLVQD